MAAPPSLARSPRRIESLTREAVIEMAEVDGMVLPWERSTFSLEDAWRSFCKVYREVSKGRCRLCVLITAAIDDDAWLEGAVPVKVYA